MKFTVEKAKTKEEKEEKHNWQHLLDPEAVCPGEMMEIGSGSERKRPIFLFRDQAQFRILGEI